MWHHGWVAIVIVAMTFAFVIHMERLKRSGGRRGRGPETHADLDELRAMAEKLASRVAALEGILDANHPDWRQKS